MDRTSSAALRLSAAKRRTKPSIVARRYPDVATLIAERAPNDPTFCFSRQNAERIVRRFQAGFPGIVTYAVKANPTRELIAAFAETGVTAFDVASPVEMALVRSVLPGAALHYNNPIRSDEEIATALDQFNVRHFVVDDHAGFERIAAHVAGRSRVEFSVRIRPARNMALHDFRSKFGTEPGDAAVLLADIAHRGFRTGLTFHPGSQCCDPAAFVALIFDAAGVARAAGVTPSTLNVGGGFPAYYGAVDAPPLERFFEDIRHAFLRTFDPAATRLVAEPGRALSAPTMSLLTRVKHRRANGDIFLNDGIYGCLMEMSQIPIVPPLRIWRGNERLRGNTVPARVYGPTCDPLDVLPKPLELPRDITAGDWLEFGLLGAYSASTLTNFNGYGRVETAMVDQIHCEI